MTQESSKYRIKRLDTNCSKLNILYIYLRNNRLHRIENNQRTVRDYELCALSLALNIDIHELVDEFLEKFGE